MFATPTYVDLQYYELLSYLLDKLAGLTKKWLLNNLVQKVVSFTVHCERGWLN